MVMKLEWTDYALARLQEVHAYLRSAAGERTAQRIKDKIFARADILAANPQAGQREELLAARPEGFRYLVEGNYKIIYWVEPDRVTVSTVFDCRQDPARMRGEVPE